MKQATKNNGIKRNYSSFLLVVTLALTASGVVVAKNSVPKPDLPEAKPLLDSIKMNVATNKFADLFMVYQGSGATNAYGNFSQSNVQPDDCGGNSKICWLRVEDTDSDGNISASEFQNAFNAHDSNGNGTLDDESPVTGQLSIRD